MLTVTKGNCCDRKPDIDGYFVKHYIRYLSLNYVVYAVKIREQIFMFGLF